jgi:hypothetical protein
MLPFQILDPSLLNASKGVVIIHSIIVSLWTKRQSEPGVQMHHRTNQREWRIAASSSQIYLPVNHLRVNVAGRAATSSRHPRVAKRTCPYAISRVFHVVVQTVSHNVVRAANNILGGIYSPLCMYTFAERRVVLVFVERQDARSCPCSTYIMGQNLLAA